jgi:hypothetical protein
MASQNEVIVSDNSKAIAVFDDDDIVIRIPIERLVRILERAIHHGKHDRDIEIVNLDAFVEDLIDVINEPGIDGLTTAEEFFVDTSVFALEDGSTALREYDSPAPAV